MSRHETQRLDAVDGDLIGDQPSYIVCTTCGRIWDIPRSFTSNPIGCPRCNGTELFRDDDYMDARHYALSIREKITDPR